MGTQNSSKTRVQPLFVVVGVDIHKIEKLFSLTTKAAGRDFGNNIEQICYGNTENGNTEKGIAPSRKLLQWCINNHEKLKQQNLKNSNSKTDVKRKKLFDGCSETKNEALSLLNNPSIPTRAWYIFEGYSFPDVFIETDKAMIVIEAKRTEPALTAKTTWLKNRDQLIRHIDTVIDNGKNKPVYSFLIVNEQNNYNLKDLENIDYYKKSLPHRSPEEIEKIKNTYLGYITWEKIAREFDITFPDTIKVYRK